jgi:NADPH-dependent 2,4-dienoyl-CoA reductase/sulfur reductase-like enzyme
MTRVVIVGGSDAGISAALRAREVDTTAEVALLLADRWPNYSICGLPYLLSGEVARTNDLAHRTRAEMEAAGIDIYLEHHAVQVDAARRWVVAQDAAGEAVPFDYDALVLATGAMPQRPPIPGLELDGVHLLHTVDDALKLADRLCAPDARRAVVMGAGYIGLEMSEALRHREVDVTLIERLPEVMPTVDPQIGAKVHDELERNGVGVCVDTPVLAIESASHGLVVQTSDGPFAADLVLVVTGVQPDVDLGVHLGVPTGTRGALAVDEFMRTGVPDVFAAGDCVHTHHRLLDQPAYLPLGTTAHKQGRVAGENAVGGHRRFAGVLGTQVVKVFDLAVASTGLRDSTAPPHLYAARTEQTTAPDHKRYYPGAVDLTIRICGDNRSGRLLGAQILGGLTGQVAKRIDVFATAIHDAVTVEALSDLDLSYTPPFGSPWDAIQTAAQHWVARATAVAAARNE